MHSVATIWDKGLTPHLEVKGTSSLSGEIKISGAKNSSLVLMAASLLTNEKVLIKNIPELTDIEVMAKLLVAAGVEVSRKPNEIEINSNPLPLDHPQLPDELVHALRASFVCIGPLLARLGKAEIPLPGGCRIGARPVDEHIQGLKALGAQVEIKEGVVAAIVPKHKGKLKGARIHFNCRSVGATETILMAATLAEGVTTIENAAQEPEVQDLANMLNKMGAKVIGAGTSTIKIEGVEKLKGCIHTVIPDRIEAGTFLLAAAITRSTLLISPVIPDHLTALIEKLRESGCVIELGNQNIKISPKSIKAVDITTMPFPGFPTDLQAPFMALMATATGTSTITETIFEKRMQHVVELQKMGASIQLNNNVASIEGVQNLTGTTISGGDLRSSAAMVLASLSAKGTSIIKGLNHLDRGYEQIEEKLNQAGAKIQRNQITENYQSINRKSAA